LAHARVHRVEVALIFDGRKRSFQIIQYEH
jgi:hypothetical protein